MSITHDKRNIIGKTLLIIISLHTDSVKLIISFNNYIFLCIFKECVFGWAHHYYYASLPNFIRILILRRQFFCYPVKHFMCKSGFAIFGTRTLSWWWNMSILNTKSDIRNYFFKFVWTFWRRSLELFPFKYLSLVL